MSDSPWKVLERTTALALSTWLAQGVKGVEGERILARQSMMGRMIERKYGDLAIHPKCSDRFLPMARWFMERFQVDAKNRKKFRLPGLLTSPAHVFWEWWAKLSGEVPRYSRILKSSPRAGDPSAGVISVEEKGKIRLMVILNNPSKEHLLVLGFEDMEFFQSALGLMDKAIPTIEIRHANTEDAVKIVVLEDFLRWADPVSLGCPKVEGSNAESAEGP